jgi:hypothetical protein
MRILSWDVGIHHLSYCILERNDEFENELAQSSEKKITIRKWGIIDLAEDPIQKKNMTYIFENIPKKLDEIPELLNNIDLVCIENQPTLKNPTMKTIQVILYSYFLIRGKTDNKEYPVKQISFISATNKLKVYQGPYINPDLYTKSGKLKNEPKSKKVNTKNQPLILEFLAPAEQDNIPQSIEIKEEDDNLETENQIQKGGSAVCYGDKKKLAILYTREMIKKDHVEYLEFFEGNKKKDDLSDSYLQGMYVLLIKNPMQKKNVDENVEDKKKRVSKPRKKKGNIMDVIEKEEKKLEKQVRKKKVKEEEQNKDIEEDNKTIVETKKQPRKRRTKEEIKKEKEDNLVEKAAEKAYLSDSSSD